MELQRVIHNWAAEHEHKHALGLGVACSVHLSCPSSTHPPGSSPTLIPFKYLLHVSTFSPQWGARWPKCHTNHLHPYPDLNFLFPQHLSPEHILGLSYPLWLYLLSPSAQTLSFMMARNWHIPDTTVPDTELVLTKRQRICSFRFTLFKFFRLITAMRAY